MSETHMDLKAEDQPTTDYVNPEATGTEEKPTGDSPAAGQESEKSETGDPANANDKTGEGDEGDSKDAKNEGDDPDKDESGKNRNKVPAKQRIDELTKKWRTAERERDDAMAELDRIKNTSEKKKDGESSGDSPAPRPKETDFDTWEEYEEAVLDWKLEQRESKSKSDKLKTAEADTQTKDAAAKKARLDVVLANGEEKFEDFKDVVSNKNVPISPAMLDAAMESDRADEILYFFGKNPDEAAKIAGLSPLAAARAIGQLEAGLDRQVNQSDKRTTNAPATIKPVKGNERTTRDPNKMSMTEYAAARDRGDI